MKLKFEEPVCYAEKLGHQPHSAVSSIDLITFPVAISLSRAALKTIRLAKNPFRPRISLTVALSSVVCLEIKPGIARVSSIV